MIYSYENDASDSYLIIEPENCNNALKYQLVMLESNNIERIADIQVRRQNDKEFYYYKITSKVSLKLFLKRKKFKKHEFIRILTDIANTLVGCGGFLLSENCFVIDPEYIYVNPETLEIYLIYVPNQILRNTGMMFKEFIIDLIIHKADIDDCEYDNFIPKILTFVREDIFNIAAFTKMLENIKYESKYETESTNSESMPKHVEVPENKMTKKEKRSINIFSKYKKSNDSKANQKIYTETIKKEESYYSTTLLGIINETKYVLIAKNSENAEEIEIDKPEFVIGRLSDQVDFTCNNYAVGKIHAQIIIRNGNVYLKDLNSINGTFLNNIRIICNKECKIENNDIISFANSHYVFKIKQ